MAGLPGKTVALGSPQSSIHQISQVQLADWMTEIEGLTGLSGFAFVRGSAAALGGLGADGDSALVVTTAAERGIYQRASGSWAKVADLPLILTESLAADQAEADRILAQAAAATASADAASASASATAAASSQSLADVARTQAQLAAVAAGATIYASVAAGEAGTVNGDVFLVSTEPGVQVYENAAGTGSFLGWLGEVLLDDVAAVLAWNPPAYPQTGLVLRTRREGFAYSVLASGVTDEDLATAGGAKLRVHPVSGNVYPLALMGADTSGATDAGPAIATLLTRMAGTGGGTLLGEPGATYQNNIQHIITSSNVVVDMAGATLTGSGKFTWNGDSGVDGDRSAVLQGSVMRNAHFTGSHEGPYMFWCDAPVLENLSRDNTTDTWINVHYSNGGYARNCIAANGDITKIAFLGFHNNGFVFEDCHVTGGSWVYALQVKGGLKNVVRDCSISGATFTHGFRSRGDAPWGATSPVGTYPFATKGWNEADDRRANIDCVFQRLSVTNSVGVPYFDQESIGTVWEDIYADGATTTAFAITKGASGKEANYTLIRPRFTNGAGRAISISGVDETNLLEGVVIEDAHIAGFTSDDAIRLTYCQSPQVVRPKIDDNTANNGLFLVDCKNWLVRDAAKMAGNGTGLRSGLVTLTQPGVAVIENGDFSGNSVDGVVSSDPVVMKNLTGGWPTVTTTDAVANTLLRRLIIPNGKIYRVSASVVYQTGSSGGAFKVACVARGNTSNVTLLGASTDVHAPINPDALGEVSFVASTQLRLVVRGKASTTVNWRLVSFECSEVL